MNNLFLVVLGLSLLADLALGAWAGAGFSNFAKTWGLSGAVPNGVAHFLGWVLATCLVGFAAIQGVAFHWTRRDKDEGPQLAIVFGGWLVLSALGTFAFASAHRTYGLTSLGWKFLVVDGLRGVGLIVLGWAALHAPSVVRELRLPEETRQSRPREERSVHPRSDRRDRRPRRFDEERGSRGGEDRRRAAGRRTDRERDLRRRRERPREEPLREDHPTAGGRRSPLAAGRESRAVAEARRLSPETAERPLTVVVKGASERIRPRVVAEVPPSDADATAASPAEAALTGEGGGRRRRRRRRRGGTGSIAVPSGEEALISDDEELDVPAVIEREFDARGGDDSGEVQEAATAVRGRNRRRRRRSSIEVSPTVDAVIEGEPEYPLEPRRASAVEALDVLRLLEPESPSSPASPRSSGDREFGRTPRPSRPRRSGAPRHPEDD